MTDLERDGGPDLFQAEVKFRDRHDERFPSPGVPSPLNK